MHNTEYLKIGQVVRSKNGRDKGDCFVILNILDDKYVEIVNGRRRTLDKPKKKKIAHLYVYKKIFSEIETRELGGYEFNDAYIRRLLEPYAEKVNQEVLLDEQR